MSKSFALVRVVVVDDQPLERTGLSLILDSGDGVSVVGEAATGEEAVPLVLAEMPDVVLMDVRMPGMGGIEATKIITAQAPDVKVLVLTTFDQDEYAFGSLRAGASGFLLKSTRTEALVDAVKTVARGSSVVDPGLTTKLIDHFVSSHRSDQGDYRGEGEGTVDADSRLDVLTARERDILHAIARGLSNAEISAELHLAETTVKSYVNAVFGKLHLRDRVHAVILGREIWALGPVNSSRLTR